MYRFALSKLVPQASGYSWTTDDTAKGLIESITNWPNGISMPTEAQLETEFQTMQTEQQAQESAKTSALNKLTALGLTSEEIMAITKN
jgi:hypothetical protein